MGQRDDIAAVWVSRYEYGRGPGDETYTSEHRIEFVKSGSKWIGTSLPNDEGSAVRFELTQRGKEFGGAWRERTSPTGHYAAHEFHGQILFVLSDDAKELKGMWLGAGSHSGRVKSGKWDLRLEEAQ